MKMCQITVVSKNKKSLDNFFLVFFKNKKLNSNAIIKKYLKKNKETKMFAILKSPHVNKTAQEQFETRFFCRELEINSEKVFKYLILLKKTKNNMFSDVNIFVLHNLQQKKPAEINLFNHNNFNFKDFANYKNKNKTILKAFDLYGEHTLLKLNNSLGSSVVE